MIPLPSTDASDETPVASAPATDAPARDHTPVGPVPIGAPARQDSQRWTPSLIVVAAILVVSLVVAAVLFIGLNDGDAPDDLPNTTVPTASAAPADGGAAPEAAPDPAPSGPVTVTGVHAWDPDGNNGSENDAQAALALADGSQSTAWATECYSDRDLGGKRGVGLVLDLSAGAPGVISVDTLNAPYQLEFYTTTEAAAPTDLAAWSQVGATHFAEQPGTIETQIEVAATHVLVWLKELGPDDACSTANPYRGRLGEISYRP
jgi:hypothetical protein